VSDSIRHVASTLSLIEAAARTWDIAVVGAGPAGATAARELARRGVGVLLIDRAIFPRSKVCGCYLNANAQATLAAVGLGELTNECGALPIHQFVLGTRGASARMPLPGGVLLSREVFDSALIHAAIAEGTDFLPGARATLEAVTGLTRTLTLTQNGQLVQLQARVVLATDGLGGNLLARAGVTEAPPVRGSRIGAGVLLNDAPSFYAPGSIYMACSSRVYMGIERLEDGRLDMAGAFDAEWVRHVGGPGAAAALALSEIDWPVPPYLSKADWRGTVALTRKARRLAAERVFAVGDAAGYVEPFTGEGMAWALAGAAALAPLAARAVTHWHPGLAELWEARYQRLVRRRQWVCRGAAVLLRRPWLVRCVVGLLSAAPILGAPVVALLNHPGVNVRREVIAASKGTSGR
jgi:flavin-dependent dehydrogenase